MAKVKVKVSTAKVNSTARAKGNTAKVNMAQADNNKDGVTTRARVEVTSAAARA